MALSTLVPKADELLHKPLFQVLTFVVPLYVFGTNTFGRIEFSALLLSPRKNLPSLRRFAFLLTGPQILILCSGENHAKSYHCMKFLHLAINEKKKRLRYDSKPGCFGASKSYFVFFLLVENEPLTFSIDEN